MSVMSFIFIGSGGEDAGGIREKRRTEIARDHAALTCDQILS